MHLITNGYESESVRRGRDILKRIMNEALEAHDAGKNPTKIIVGANLLPDIQAFWDEKTERFDGIPPRRMHGLPIEYDEHNREGIRIV